jgi:hypothetical protein
VSGELKSSEPSAPEKKYFPSPQAMASFLLAGRQEKIDKPSAFMPARLNNALRSSLLDLTGSAFMSSAAGG